MALSKVDIQKQAGGLGRKAPSEDAIAGIIMGGVTTTGYSTIGEVIKVTSLKDAEDTYGFTESYDTNNGVLVHYHISEIFRMNPDLNELYIMLVTQKTDTAGVGLADMLDPANDFATKMIQESNGRIRQLGVALNPDQANYTASVTNGIDDDSEAAIAQAQALYDQEGIGKYRPLHIIIEGRSFDGSASGLFDARTKSAKAVSITIAQDPDKNDEDPDHAATGTALGAVSRARVDMSIGWVQEFNLVDEAQNRWTGINLSSGADISTYTESDLETIHDKGFIFVRQYVGNDGAYFNGAPVCAAVDSDFAWIQDQRVIDKAVRLVYAKLLPQVNRPLEVDPDSGQIDSSLSKFFESLALDAIDPMSRNNEISGKDAFVDPEQDVLATSQLVAEIEIVPKGTGRTITAKIGFNNPFSG